MIVLAACRYGFIEHDARLVDDTAPPMPGADAVVDTNLVTIDDAMIDVPLLPCPGACTSCKLDGTCVIDCSGGCTNGVTCPAGRPCEVICIGSTACELGRVDCSAASSCLLTCRGTDACDRGVICGGTTCTVICDGSAACEDAPIVCNAAICAITCSGSTACNTGVCCNGAGCGASCSAVNGGNCAPPGGGC